MPVASQTRPCRVGYALNAKKMRKSLPDSTSIENLKRHWQGGGLSDLLETPHEGIIFAPFEYDTAIKNSEVWRTPISSTITDFISCNEGI
jgi:hypothetical protein